MTTFISDVHTYYKCFSHKTPQIFDIFSFDKDFAQTLTFEGGDFVMYYNSMCIFVLLCSLVMT